MDLSFYKGKKVFLTGHTGFKGSWMCKALQLAGADVYGYSLEPPTSPSLFKLAYIEEGMTSVIGDIRNLDYLKKIVCNFQPEIMIHLAAQPIVRDSYKNPVNTYEINVMGTVNFLEAARHCESVKSIINVTTDKVYFNNEWAWGYRENDQLNGIDPYSNSKSCSELITSSYTRSFFNDSQVGISTMRAGNVIGGGDFANDRIIPDCIRAMQEGKDIIVRNPYSIRPYQHVLDPIMAYLLLAQKQYSDKKYSGNYNIGPDEMDCVTTGKLVTLFCNKWEIETGNKQVWVNKYDGGPHEANFLKLDCSKFKSIFDWTPKCNIESAVEKTVEWVKVYFDNGVISSIMSKQIHDFLN